MISAHPNEIVFLSGGTEANNMVLNMFKCQQKLQNGYGAGDEVVKLPHIITSSIEHVSITKPLEKLRDDGLVEVTFVDVDKTTHAIRVEDVLQAIQPQTTLISLMLANNETGVLQPVKELSEKLRPYQHSNRKIYLHTDACQAIGKIPVSVKDLSVDYLTIAGHKFYGPRIGALYVRGLGHCNGAPLQPMILGGGQENGYRAGTENVAMIVGLGKASELVSSNIHSYQSQLLSVRDYLEDSLQQKFGSLIHFNAKSSDSTRLPNTCNFSLVGKRFLGRAILQHCKVIIAGVGAACHSNAIVASPILLNSGIPSDIAVNAIRLSVGIKTSFADIDVAVEDIWNAYQAIAHPKSHSQSTEQ
ncbi:selenocysteine lyase-like [Watersipora subatra]|uniref:selenocysteine lyase-like n=1 Tax=Watersipora subatra TaxID=2589382 RepID=UPI00355C2FFA